MGLTDPVVWGSILTVIIAIIIVVFLSFKVKTLMDKDAESHKR
jgi:ABC-type proline/glycine betaine transport system permease subunit